MKKGNNLKHIYCYVLLVLIFVLCFSCVSPTYTLFPPAYGGEDTYVDIRSVEEIQEKDSDFDVNLEYEYRGSEESSKIIAPFEFHSVQILAVYQKNFLIDQDASVNLMLAPGVYIGIAESKNEYVSSFIDEINLDTPLFGGGYSAYGSISFSSHYDDFSFTPGIDYACMYEHFGEYKKARSYIYDQYQDDPASFGEEVSSFCINAGSSGFSSSAKVFVDIKVIGFDDAFIPLVRTFVGSSAANSLLPYHDNNESDSSIIGHTYFGAYLGAKINEFIFYIRPRFENAEGQFSCTFGVSY